MADVKAESSPKPAASKARKFASMQHPLDLVTIIVLEHEGSEPEKFIVHKDFATHYSPVFDKAFNSEFIEGQTQTYKLERTTKRAMKLLVNWMYTQRLDYDLITEGQMPAEAKFSAKCRLLAEFWVLADRLVIPALQNQTIRELESLRKEYNVTPTDSVVYIYENTSPGSCLRRWMLTACAFDLKGEWYTKKSYQFPREILLELATLLVSTFPAEAKLAAKTAQGSFEVSED